MKELRVIVYTRSGAQFMSDVERFDDEDALEEFVATIKRIHELGYFSMQLEGGGKVYFNRDNIEAIVMETFDV